MELGSTSGDGPFHKVLVDLINEIGLLSWVTDIFTRGLWSEGYDKKTNPESAVSGDLRRRLRRKEKRLSERGRVEHLAIRPEDDVGRWSASILALMQAASEQPGAIAR